MLIIGALGLHDVFFFVCACDYSPLILITPEARKNCCNARRCLLDQQWPQRCFASIPVPFFLFAQSFKTRKVKANKHGEFGRLLVSEGRVCFNLPFFPAFFFLSKFIRCYRYRSRVTKYYRERDRL